MGKMNKVCVFLIFILMLLFTQPCFAIKIGLQTEVNKTYIGAICGLINDVVTNNTYYGEIKLNEYVGDYSGVAGIYANASTELDVYLENLDGDFATKHSGIDSLKASDIYWE